MLKIKGVKINGNTGKQDMFPLYNTDVDSLILKYGSYETLLFVNGKSGKKKTVQVLEQVI